MLRHLLLPQCPLQQKWTEIKVENWFLIDHQSLIMISYDRTWNGEADHCWQVRATHQMNQAPLQVYKVSYRTNCPYYLTNLRRSLNCSNYHLCYSLLAVIWMFKVFERTINFTSKYQCSLGVVARRDNAFPRVGYFDQWWCPGARGVVFLGDVVWFGASILRIRTSWTFLWY